MLAALVGVPACGRVSPPPIPATMRAPADRSRVAGQYLVTLAPGTGPKVLSGLYGRFGIRRIEALGAGRFLMVLGQDPGPPKIEALRAHDPRIRSIQPNFIYRAAPSGQAQ